MSNTITTNTFVPGNLIKSSEVNTNFDDVTNNGLIPVGVSSAQNYFETLKHAGDVDNEDYLIADIFTDADGDKDTISTGATGAIYDSENLIYLAYPAAFSTGTLHDPDSFTDAANAFDANATSYASKAPAKGPFDYDLGRTFSSQYVSGIYYKVTVNIAMSGTGNPALRTYVIETYDGAAWNVVNTFSHTLAGSHTVGEYIKIDDTIEGIRLNLSSNGTSNTPVIQVQCVNAAFSTATDVTTTTLIALDGTEKGIIVFDKSIKPTDTSITIDVSDGSTILTSQPVRSYIDISTLSSGSLTLDFNFISTESTATAQLYGYGVCIVK